MAEKSGNEVALEKLNGFEKNIHALRHNPNIAADPKYPVLKRRGYKILVLEKDIVFYKVNESRKEVILYAVADQRQDYLTMIRGM